jgi:hypothetical protein
VTLLDSDPALNTLNFEKSRNVGTNYPASSIIVNHGYASEQQAKPLPAAIRDYVIEDMTRRS